MKTVLLVLLILATLSGVPAQANPSLSGHMVLSMGDPDHKPRMVLLNPVSGATQTLSNEIVTFPRFSKDGGSILYAAVAGDSHVIKLYDLHKKAAHVLVPGMAFPACWLPDGGFVATSAFAVCVFNSRGQAMSQLLKRGDSATFGDVSGQTFFFEDQVDDVSVLMTLALDGGEPEKLFEGSQPRISPDGRTMVYLLYEGSDLKRVRIMLYDIQTHKKRVLQDLGTSHWAFAPTFSPDGAFVAYVGGVNAAHNHYVSIVSLDGHPVKTLPLSDSADHLDWGR